MWLTQMHNKQMPFLYRQSLYLSITFVMLWLVFPVGGAIDLNFISPFINEQGEFYLRHSWALAELNHRYVKNILICIYLLFFMGWIASFKSSTWRTRRWEYGYFFVMVVISTAIIGLLKSQSDHACPWNMLIDSTSGWSWDFHATEGHCFPGGHASTGFALMVGYFVYRLQNPKRAYFFLSAAILLGFAMGFAQMMRGAHFLSHNLWTAWIIWFMNVIAYSIFQSQLPLSSAAEES